VENTSFLVLLVNKSLALEHPHIDSWSMIRIDLESHKILYCDPRLDRTSALSNFAVNSLEKARSEILLPVLRVLLSDYAGNWPLAINDYQYYSTLEGTNLCDCGVYIVACLFYTVQAVPVFIDQSGILRLRKQLAYWIICGALPY
jgi:hypothetical protein